MSSKTDSFLSRTDTKAIKGIAIILMLMNHLWSFPDRIAGDGLRNLFSIFGQSSLTYLGPFGQICVSLFLFVGGYGTYLEFHNKQYDVVAKIKRLYVAFWKVFLIFVPIGFLFFSSQPAYCADISIPSRYAEFNWNNFFVNFTGFYTNYNSEWWFLYSYVIALLSFPIARAIAEKHSPKVNILLVMIAGVMASSIIPAIKATQTFAVLNSDFVFAQIISQSVPNIACFWMGIVAAKDGLLERLNTSLKSNGLLNPVTDVLLFALIVFLRQSITSNSMDIIYVPVIVVLSINFLSYIKPLRYVMLALGKQSTNMWLIHTFLCYYFYALVKIVIAPKWGILSLLVLIIMSYLLSVAVYYFWKAIELVINKGKLLWKK